MRIVNAGVVAAALLWAELAPAHGGTPVAQNILVNPADPEHVLVATKFGGFFLTRDGGENWEWVCEQAIGYQSNDAPPAALTASGTAAVSVAFEGISVGSGETCSFDLWAPSADAPHFADLRLAAHDPRQVLALRSNYVEGAYVTQVWRGDPELRSWAAVGRPLASDLIGISVGAAPSDARRVYVAGGILDVETVKTLPILENSRDEAANFERYAPELEGTLRLIAVAEDPDVAFVRVEGWEGVDQILVFTAGGTAHHTAFLGTGVLPAGALSPDGSELVIGGPLDGIWRAPAADLATGKSDAFVKIADLETHALTWTLDGLYSGGNASDDGFSVGVSRDQGETFEPFLVLCEVAGPISCAESAGGACPLEGDFGWSSLTAFFPTAACEKPAEPPLEPIQPEAKTGCACRSGSAPPKGPLPWMLAAAGAWALAQRRAWRTRSPPELATRG